MTILFIIGGVWCLVSSLLLWSVCKIAGKSLLIREKHRDTILAIDDDTAILDVEKTALESEGYNVHVVANPMEALRYYAEHWQSIKLVLLDFLMPEMTGDRVFERLREIDPQVPVLLVTGYHNRIQSSELKSGVCGCLLKPFPLDDLVRKVRDAAGFA